MSSSAVASFTVKGIGLDIPPASDVTIGLATILKKSHNDLKFGLKFSEASLRDPKSCQGVSLFAEKPLGGGVKGAVSYDVQKRSPTVALTMKKDLSGSDLELKAIYKQAGDVFILEEQWRFDENNKLSGAYNFSNEEAQFAFTHSRGPWSGTSRYNFRTEATILEISKKEGKSTLTGAYNIKDESLSLTWNKKPYKVVAKGRVGRNGISAVQTSLSITHDFDL